MPVEKEVIINNMQLVRFDPFKSLLDDRSDVFKSVFTFRQREMFAESQELDQALSNLDAAGLISRYNQTPKYYATSEILDTCFNEFSSATLNRAGIDEAFLESSARLIKPKLTCLGA